MRSQFYRAARDLGDLQAAEKGPSALGKRYARKAVYRKSNTATRQLLRMVGLSR